MCVCFVVVVVVIVVLFCFLHKLTYEYLWSNDN